jgi:hypothetical protein
MLYIVNSIWCHLVEDLNLVLRSSNVIKCMIHLKETSSPVALYWDSYFIFPSTFTIPFENVIEILVKYLVHVNLGVNAKKSYSKVNIRISQGIPWRTQKSANTLLLGLRAHTKMRVVRINLSIHIKVKGGYRVICYEVSIVLLVTDRFMAGKTFIAMFWKKIPREWF